MKKAVLLLLFFGVQSFAMNEADESAQERASLKEKVAQLLGFFEMSKITRKHKVACTECEGFPLCPKLSGPDFEGDQARRAIAEVMVSAVPFGSESAVHKTVNTMAALVLMAALQEHTKPITDQDRKNYTLMRENLPSACYPLFDHAFGWDDDSACTQPTPAGAFAGGRAGAAAAALDDGDGD